MKAKNFWMIVLAILISVFLTACGTVGPTDPDNPDTTPHRKFVTVKYARVLPIPYPDAGDMASVVWTYGSYQGGRSDMPKTEENTFQVSGVSIETETTITMYVADPREWNGSSAWVCKYIYIDGQELVVSSTWGMVKFKYGNDGKVKVVS